MKKLLYLLMIPFTMFFISCDDEDMNDMEDEMNPTLVEAAQEAGLTTLLDAVNAVDGLDQELLSANEITVFAPNNAAFSAALEAFNAANLNELVAILGGVEELERVLKYHVIASAVLSTDLSEEQTVNTLAGGSLLIKAQDGNVTITDGAGNMFNVVTADVEIENGVVHVIDGVLLPNAPEEPAPTLGEAVAATPSLSTLGTAVGTIDGLLEDLEDAEALTVFAPTNDAFTDALELYGVNDLAGLVSELGGEEVLETLLSYHVVAGAAFSSSLTNGQMIETLTGGMLEVEVDGSNVTVTDAAGNTYAVTTADVEIENGVVHIINGVLIPNTDLLPKPTLGEAVTATASLETLGTAVAAVDALLADLEAANAITVFAPDNDAFAAALNLFEVDNLDDLVTELGGIDKLETVLGFHVVPATAFAADLNEGANTFTTLAEQELTVTRAGSSVTVSDGANTYDVLTADVAIDNGVVHIIEGVLLPELTYPTVAAALENTDDLSTLDAAIEAAGLGSALVDAEAITVFAPQNAAFGPLLDRYDATDLADLIQKIGLPAVQEVLKFHVVPAVAFSHDLAEGEQTFPTLVEGQEITVTKNADGVFVTDYLGFTYQVTAPNVVIDNGVVHIIDGVVLPDLSSDPNIAEAATSGGLTTLLDAVIAAELDDDLIQATEITVFAPDNDAFVDLLQAQEVNDLDGLINKLGAANVAKVLQFHVVPAVAFSQDLAEGNQTFTTLVGEELTVNKTGSVVTVTDANANTFTVTTADVTIENGVVHVIDGVLLPTL